MEENAPDEALLQIPSIPTSKKMEIPNIAFTANGGLKLALPKFKEIVVIPANFLTITS